MIPTVIKTTDALLRYTDRGQTPSLGRRGAAPDQTTRHCRVSVPGRVGRAAASTFLLGCTLVGCAAPLPARVARLREVETAARPLLEMWPDANWTACYNRLLELGPTSIDYLVSRPIMRRRAAPDDLRVMLHTSLLRLLAEPGAAPRLSVSCFETTLDVLHFNPKVRGRPLGQVCLPTARLPQAWHDLYPADFNHALAADVDVETDRRIMLRWWRARRGAATTLVRRPLRPRPDYLWAVLSRRFADVWTYQARPEVWRCSWPPGRSALFRGTSYDYNLVRAVCIWLGSSDLPGTQDRLIELVAHPSEIVAYNARFALQHSRDPRIREVLERYKEPRDPAPPAEIQTVAATLLTEPKDPYSASFSRKSCGAQRSATHEMGQIHVCLCGGGRGGDVHGRPFRGD